MRLPSRLEDERKSCVIPCLLFRQSPYFWWLALFLSWTASYRPWHWVPASPAYTMPGRTLPGRRVPRFASALVIPARIPESRARD